jgi:uncharacterized protein
MKKLIACLLFALPMAAQAASFDCNKASSKTEKAICADPELSKLDEELAAAYKEMLKVHPVPDYIKARQRDWLGLNKYCDAKKLNACLIKNYKEQIARLQFNKSTQVYANARKFSYTGGDMVVEITPETGKMSVWGGFAVHNQASQAEGKTIYTGCEFDGNLKSKAMTSAVGDAGEISFKIKNNMIDFDGSASEKMCAGFARIPPDIKRVN